MPFFMAATVMAIQRLIKRVAARETDGSTGVGKNGDSLEGKGRWKHMNSTADTE